MIPSRLLAQFLEVARTGNLRAAAANVGISQPALTKNIQQLEGTLEVTLFDRHPRGMTLTAYGQVLARRAKVIELEHSYALSEINSMRGGSKGVVRIGAGPLWSYRYVPAAVAMLHRRFPEGQVKIETGTSLGLYSALSAGDLDLCAFGLDEVPAEDGVFELEELSRFAMSVFARRGHPLARAMSVEPEALARYSWITFQGDAGLRRRLDEYFAGNNLPGPSIAVESTSFSTAISIACRGDYLICLAAALEEDVRLDGLVRLPINIWTFSGGVCFRRTAADLPYVSTLISILRQLTRDSP